MVLAADHRTPSIGLVFSSGDGEARWLCDVDFLPQIAVEEARLHIHVASFLVQPQLAGAARTQGEPWARTPRRSQCPAVARSPWR